MKTFINRIVVLLVTTLFFFVEKDYVENIIYQQYETMNSSVIVDYSYIVLALLLLYICMSNRPLQLPKFIRSYVVFYLIVVSLSFVHAMVRPQGILLFVKMSLAPLAICALYGYIKKHTLQKLEICFLTILFLGLSWYIFSSRSAMFVLSGNTETVSSSAYLLLFLLPFIYSINNRYIKIIGVLIVATALFLSFKRTGFISLILSMVVYLFSVWHQNKSTILKRLIIILTLIGIGIIVKPYFDDSMIVSRLLSISEDGGSNRDVVYNDVWNLIQNMSSSELLFGNGWNAVAEANTLSAHNDFLEIVYDQGLIATLAYLYFLLHLFKFAYIKFRHNDKIAAPIIGSIAIFAVNSTFSHIFLYPIYMLSFAAFWGYISAISYKEENVIV